MKTLTTKEIIILKNLRNEVINTLKDAKPKLIFMMHYSLSLVNPHQEDPTELSFELMGGVSTKRETYDMRIKAAENILNDWFGKKVGLKPCDTVNKLHTMLLGPLLVYRLKHPPSQETKIEITEAINFDGDLSKTEYPVVVKKYFAIEEKYSAPVVKNEITQPLELKKFVPLILQAAAEYIKQPAELILAKSRKKILVHARIACMMISRYCYPEVSICMIERAFKKIHSYFYFSLELHELLIDAKNEHPEAMEYKKLVTAIAAPFSISIEKLQEKIELKKKNDILLEKMAYCTSRLLIAMASKLSGLAPSEILSERRTDLHVITRLSVLIRLKALYSKAGCAILGRIMNRKHSDILYLFSLHEIFNQLEYEETNDTMMLRYKEFSKALIMI